MFYLRPKRKKLYNAIIIILVVIIIISFLAAMGLPYMLTRAAGIF
jgi:flagellar basal body-associated protein FliL